MKNTVIEIIKDVTGLTKIDETADLIDDGILDSLAFIELINEIDDRLNIEVQPTLVSLDVWRSVDSIVAMLTDETFSKK